MNAQASVLMVVTLDTWAAEARYVRDVLEAHHVRVIHLTPPREAL